MLLIVVAVALFAGAAAADPPASLCGGLTGDITVSGGPANDNYSSAEELTGASDIASGTLMDATVQDAGAPAEFDSAAEGSFESLFGFAGASRSAWYCWQAPADGGYRLTTEGSPDPYDGTSYGETPALTLLDMNGESDWANLSSWSSLGGTFSNGGVEPGLFTEVVFQATAGETYLIRVSNGDWAGIPDDGDFELALQDLSSAAPRLVTTDWPSLDGDGYDPGAQLSAYPGTWVGAQPIAIGYQWQRCDENGENCTAISDATSSTYMTTAADEGYWIGVAIEAANGVDSTSMGPAEVGVWQIGGVPWGDAPPVVSPEADRVGEVFTATSGTWHGTAPFTYTYRWQRFNGTTYLWEDISGATSTTYTAVGADVGYFNLRVLVEATNGYGTGQATSWPVAVLSDAGAPYSASGLTISGLPEVSETLTASGGAWGGELPITFTYRWLRCTNPQDPGVACTPLSGATSSSYTVTTADQGWWLQAQLTGTNANGSGYAFSGLTEQVPGSAAPVNGAEPWIEGSATVGETLTGFRGGWAGSPTIAFAYQWQRCNSSGANCVDVSGATSGTYDLLSTDAGYTIRLEVAGSNSVGSGTATSPPTVVIETPTAPTNTSLPTISGNEFVDQTLTVSESDWSGTKPIGYAYEWRRCDTSGANCSAISGAAGATYQLVTGDDGHTLRVQVTATNSAGSDAALSNQTGVIDTGSPPTNTAIPTISGTPFVGQTLTATHGTWTGSAPIVYTYQWRRCDTSGASCSNISGATAASYDLVSVDEGHTLRLRVEASNALDTVSADSAATEEVALPSAPASTTQPTISGTPQAGATLTASTGGWSYWPTSFAYQWQMCEGSACFDIRGETASSYTATNADVGYTIRVVVRATNGFGTTAAASERTSNVNFVASAPGAPILYKPITSSLLAARFHEGFFVGWSLPNPPGTWSYPTSDPAIFTYRWLRCDDSGRNCVLTADETSGLYGITSPDIGFTLRLVVTATNSAGSVIVVMHASYPVRPRDYYSGPPVFQSLPTIAGTAEVGQILTASNGTWTGSPTSYEYEWRRCNSVGRSCRWIPGATGATYTVASDDAGQTLRLQVRAANGSGNSQTFSLPFGIGMAQAGPTAETADGPCENPRYASTVRVNVACEELFASDPVNLATGALSESVTDAAIPSSGEPFCFVRSYSSRSAISGELGPGWTDSYSARLTLGANFATYTSETGARIVFARQVDGSYEPSPWATAKLSVVTGGYELTLATQTHLGFDEQGRLSSVTDRNGEGVEIVYDSSGRRSTLTDSAGREVTFTYNASGLLSTLSLPDAREVTYGYTSGRLTSVTDLAGGTTSYSYDDLGRLRTITDPNGHRVVQNTYDADGRVLQQEDALGHVTAFDWDTSTGAVTLTDARNNQWTYTFENNLLVSKTDPLGNEVEYGYDPDTFDLVSYTDALGNAVEMTYDAAHNLVSRTAPAPLSYEEVFEYNARNDLTSVTDGRSNETTYDYDINGNLTAVTRPGSTVTEYVPDNRGLVTSITNPRGKTTELGYDAQGNLNSVTSPLENVTSFNYDETGRLTSMVDPRGNEVGADPEDYTTLFEYDDADRVVTTADPLGNETSSTYDPAGNLTSNTDANGNATTYTYDDADRLVTVTAPDDSATTYTYDEVGNILTRTDANDHTTTFTYDDANRLITVQDPLDRQWSFEYDANGNLTQTTIPTLATVTRSYDVLGRLTGIDYSDATPDVTYEYDANGNRSAMTDGVGTVSYSHDALNRLTEVERGTDTFAYTYDAASNLLSRQYPDGITTTYTFDDEGRLATAAVGPSATSYSYDAAGQLTSTALPNGLLETRAYDRAGRPVTIESEHDSTVITSNEYTLPALTPDSPGVLIGIPQVRLRGLPPRFVAEP